jgi:aminoglycoside phosphotransferase (APT) family kinase protein
MTGSAEELRGGLEAYLSAREGAPVVVDDLQPVSSVGNARDPWSFTARWGGRTVRCVMLIKAASGQLETELGPEFHTLSRLEGSGVPAPRALWLDEAGEAVGRPFFVTGWVPGTADIHQLKRGEHHAATRGVALELAAAAARLHRLELGLFDHLPPTTAQSAAADQLDAWYQQFERHRLEPHPGLVYALAWLRARPPRAHRVSLVHGDLRFGNLLAHEGHLTALLDWEMVHLGDPVEDLGWVYRELWSPAGALDFDQFLDAYRAAGGPPFQLDHLRWYQVFAEVKHSIISLTATRSFSQGSSVRHANRAATVPAFLRRALQLIDEGAGSPSRSRPQGPTLGAGQPAEAGPSGSPPERPPPATVNGC